MFAFEVLASHRLRMRRRNCERRSVIQGRSPDSQVIAMPAAFPSAVRTVALMPESLAAYSGGTVRDLHPLPFSLTAVASTLETEPTNNTDVSGRSNRTIPYRAIAYLPLAYQVRTILVILRIL